MFPWTDVFSAIFLVVSDLLARLESLRGAEKTVQEVGPTMMDWVSVKKENVFIISNYYYKVATLNFSSLRPLHSFLVWRRISHIAVIRLGQKLCWIRKSRTVV